jgi:hypothetical protein
MWRPPLAGAGYGGSKAEGRMFFFEKENQKTFAGAAAGFC